MIDVHPYMLNVFSLTIDVVIIGVRYPFVKGDTIIDLETIHLPLAKLYLKAIHMGKSIGLALGPK